MLEQDHTYQVYLKPVVLTMRVKVANKVLGVVQFTSARATCIQTNKALNTLEFNTLKHGQPE